MLGLFSILQESFVCICSSEFLDHELNREREHHVWFTIRPYQIPEGDQCLWPRTGPRHLSRWRSGGNRRKGSTMRREEVLWRMRPLYVAICLTIICFCSRVAVCRLTCLFRGVVMDGELLS